MSTEQADWTGPSEEVAITREQLGRIVREAWVEWAREQPSPKDSWLTGWDDLDEGQREVDMRIGEAVAKARLRWQMTRGGFAAVTSDDIAALAALLRDADPLGPR